MNKLKVGLGIAVILVVALAATNAYFYVAQQNNINSLSDDKTSLQAQISQLQTDKTGLQSQTNALTNDKTSLQAQVSQLQTQVSQLQVDKTSLQSSTSSLNTQISSLNAQVSSLNAQIASLQSKIGIPFTLSTTSNATSPTPGKDYVFLITGSNDTLMVKNQPGASTINITVGSAPSKTNYAGAGNSMLNYFVNLKTGEGVIAFQNVTFTIKTLGTFTGTYCGILKGPANTAPTPYPASPLRLFSMVGLILVLQGPNGQTMVGTCPLRPAGGSFTWTGTIIPPP